MFTVHMELLVSAHWVHSFHKSMHYGLNILIMTETKFSENGSRVQPGAQFSKDHKIYHMIIIRLS